MTEILLLGSFHFLESEIDFCTDEIQKELDAIVNNLKKFKPDAIAIETAKHAQDRVDSSYGKLNLNDFFNFEKMKNENLGVMKMFSQTFSLKYNNESIQIAYRLGKLLGHNKLYAIDDDTDLNMDAMQYAIADVHEAINSLQSDIAKIKSKKLVDQLKYYNSENWSKLNHDIYIKANAISLNGDYRGAEMIGNWYLRNLKIFSNIQRLAKNYDRLFVLYGAGHLQILKDLIKSDDNLKIVDTDKYL